MMAMAAVIGLTAGKRLLNSSSCYSDITEKLPNANDNGITYHQVSSTRNVIVGKKPSSYGASFPSTNWSSQSIKVLKQQVDTASILATAATWLASLDDLEEESTDLDYSVEALLLLQKSMLEKQWNLSFDRTISNDSPSRKSNKKIPITCSGVSARQRRISARRKTLNRNKTMAQATVLKPPKSAISPELLQNHVKGYVKGIVSEELLSHGEVVHLSRQIKWGLTLEDHKFRLKERLGSEPSDEQVAASLKISRAELQSQLIACSLARERLAMSNVRLVMSIAQRYDNMGAEMADLVQGGLIGLLRGIEKFDSSKGFKISTYVYWWIRQGVSRALVDNSRTLRLPNHLHERLGLIRNAKIQLEEKGVTPSIDRIAESLNMSKKKVRNATEAISKVFSFDREAFPSLNGLPGETHHGVSAAQNSPPLLSPDSPREKYYWLHIIVLMLYSIIFLKYVADKCLENNPWHGVDKWALKDEVNKLINMTLQEREREIIRLYYGLDKESLTWEDISRRIGLSRERVRQVGLVALEKLKLAARKRKMEAMLVKY